MQHIPKSLFDRQLLAAKSQPAESRHARSVSALSLPAKSPRQLQVPAGRSERKFAPIDSALIWPQQFEDHSSTKSSGLVAIVGLGALAGLGLIAGAGTMFIVVAVLAVTFALLVACVAWTMNNTPFS